QTSGVTANLRDVFFVDANRGWAVGNGGVILTSNDGGATWTPEQSGVSANLRGVFFVNATTGFAVGDNGAILKRGISTVGSLASVSAASFLGAELAAESIVAAFGQNLATTTQVAPGVPLPTELAGTTVKVRDSAGVTRLAGVWNAASVERPAGLFFVAPTQVNYQIPPGTAAGAATVTITSGAGAVSAGTVNIASVAPGLFTANASGQGVAAAVVFRRRADGSESFEPVARFDQAQNRFVPVPIDLGPETDQVFLILYGVGFRFRSSLSATTVTIGGVSSEVLFAGDAPGFVGLDQSNVRLSRSLIGRGEVDVVLVVDGKAANAVRAGFR
ncbi:MAG: YCF48-related protein, partial [Blastocatellia bacterium]